MRRLIFHLFLVVSENFNYKPPQQSRLLGNYITMAHFQDIGYLSS